MRLGGAVISDCLIQFGGGHLYLLILKKIIAVVSGRTIDKQDKRILIWTSDLKVL